MYSMEAWELVSGHGGPKNFYQKRRILRLLHSVHTDVLIMTEEDRGRYNLRLAAEQLIEVTGTRLAHSEAIGTLVGTTCTVHKANTSLHVQRMKFDMIGRPRSMCSLVKKIIGGKGHGDGTYGIHTRSIGANK